MVCSWKGGVWLLSSPDGISFTPMFGKPVVPGSDTQNVAFYDHLTERYVGYIRIDNPVPRSTRATSRVRSRRQSGALGGAISERNSHLHGLALSQMLRTYSPSMRRIQCAWIYVRLLSHAY